MYFGTRITALLASAAMAALTAFVVCKKYCRPELMDVERLAMRLLSMGIMLWGIGDWLTLLTELLSITNLHWLQIVELPHRLLPVFLFGWITFSLVYGLKIWRGEQLILDIAITTMLLFGIFWMTYFDSSPSKFE